MPLTHGTLIHRYTHHDKPGRHQVLDARSLEWLHEHTRGVLKPAAHPPRVPVLNQADLLAQGIRLSRAVAGTEDVDALGPCTGNAAAAAAASTPSSWARKETTRMLKAIDVSSLQADRPDLTGVDVVVIKASEGRTYANPKRVAQATAARAEHKQVGWYHFLWPGNIQAQAQWFIDCANPKPGDVLACDWETTTAGTAATCAEKDAFLAAVKKLRPHLRVVLYCNLDYWKNRDVTSKCGDGLWIADPGAEAGHPRVTHTWVIHQYGIRHSTDVDVCNFATVGDWKVWAGAPAPTPPAHRPYAPPPFPAGLAPGKSRPSAKPLQEALRKAGFLHITDADLSDVYGPRTQAGVGRFFAAHPQFRGQGKPHDVAIGPRGWAYLFTLAYGRK